MANILIIGSGGREHALGWSIGLDSQVDNVFYAPGNAGTSLENKAENIYWLNPNNFKDTNKVMQWGEYFEKVSDFIKEKKIDLTVIGPEDPLANGIVDHLNKRDIQNVFGPTKMAACIESNKFDSYDIMEAKKIPQAFSVKCYTKQQAIHAIHNLTTDKGVVIKAKGLTAGKGVSVCDSLEEALLEIEEHSKKYGEHVLIAERRFGEEFSVFGLSDGNKVYPIEMSFQDHKRLLDNDQGPNTGGMGAYGPAPVADRFMVRKVADEIMTPVVQYMRDTGKLYKGFLYAGLMLTAEGLIVIEFNARFGDPEAQPAMMMLKNGIYAPIMDCLEGKGTEMEFKPGASCCVVLASEGYPDSKKIKNGYVIKWPSLKDDGGKIFHSGTAYNENGSIVTAGGRVLGVTSYSSNGLNKAKDLADYNATFIKKATDQYNNANVFHMRHDIGSKGLR